MISSLRRNAGMGIMSSTLAAAPALSPIVSTWSAESSCAITGVDINEGMLTVARRNPRCWHVAAAGVPLRSRGAFLQRADRVLHVCWAVGAGEPQRPDEITRDPRLRWQARRQADRRRGQRGQDVDAVGAVVLDRRDRVTADARSLLQVHTDVFAFDDRATEQFWA